MTSRHPTSRLSQLPGRILSWTLVLLMVALWQGGLGLRGTRAADSAAPRLSSDEPLRIAASILAKRPEAPRGDAATGTPSDEALPIAALAWHRLGAGMHRMAGPALPPDMPGPSASLRPQPRAPPFGTAA